MTDTRSLKKINKVLDLISLLFVCLVLGQWGGGHRFRIFRGLPLFLFTSLDPDPEQGVGIFLSAAHTLSLQ